MESAAFLIALTAVSRSLSLGLHKSRTGLGYVVVDVKAAWVVGELETMVIIAGERRAEDLVAHSV